jgi:hypothetical protein
MTTMSGDASPEISGTSMRSQEDDETTTTSLTQTMEMGLLPLVPDHNTDTSEHIFNMFNSTSGKEAQSSLSITQQQDEPTTITPAVPAPAQDSKTPISQIVVPPPKRSESTRPSPIPSNNVENNAGGKRTFTATVTDYDSQECDGFLVEAAVASFILKGEDRFAFVTSSSEPQLGKCSMGGVQ